MPQGWAVELCGPQVHLQLEHLSDDADEWFGEGPGGSAMGPLASVIGAAARPHADRDWQAIAVATLRREGRAGQPRAGLIVRRGTGAMFHATRTANRASIARDGLDWRRMQTLGIAGSIQPESPGVFLCSSRESARWFADMVHGETADIWHVRVDGLWLISDPGTGGLDDDWMIATEPIPPASLDLVERDLMRRARD
jgi:hypothetical protein